MTHSNTGVLVGARCHPSIAHVVRQIRWRRSAKRRRRKSSKLTHLQPGLSAQKPDAVKDHDHDASLHRSLEHVLPLGRVVHREADA